MGNRPLPVTTIMRNQDRIPSRCEAGFSWVPTIIWIKPGSTEERELAVSRLVPLAPLPYLWQFSLSQASCLPIPLLLWRPSHTLSQIVYSLNVPNQCMHAQRVALSAAFLMILTNRAVSSTYYRAAKRPAASSDTLVNAPVSGEPTAHAHQTSLTAYVTSKLQ
jgi:hypothetical protein